MKRNSRRPVPTEDEYWRERAWLSNIPEEQLREDAPALSAEDV